MIQGVKRDYNVDENLVVATGFSDGASGSYYLALTHPTPFAAFVPLNGHLAVTQAGGLQTHLLNLLNKPLYVVNTENDSLYPSASVKPLVEALQELGADLVWRDIPEFTHNPMYLPQERPAIWTWLQQKHARSASEDGPLAGHERRAPPRPLARRHRGARRRQRRGLPGPESAARPAAACSSA